jgi:hypothetical protein
MSIPMWIRSAFWIGRPRPGCANLFHDAIAGELAPMLRRLPGVQDARVLWPRQADDPAPAIACQVLVEFASRDDLDRMLAAPERAAMRTRVAVVLADLFDGTLSHIDYQVD